MITDRRALLEFTPDLARVLAPTTARRADRAKVGRWTSGGARIHASMSKLRVKVGARDTAGVQASIRRRQLTRHLSISSRPQSPTRPAFAMHEIRGPERFPHAPTSPGLAVDARTGWKGSLRGPVPAVTSPVSLRVAPDLACSQHGQPSSGANSAPWPRERSSSGQDPHGGPARRTRAGAPTDESPARPLRRPRAARPTALRVRCVPTGSTVPRASSS